MKVQISVRGRTYTVKSDEDDVDIEAVAKYVDDRLNEISTRASAGADEYTVALLRDCLFLDPCSRGDLRGGRRRATAVARRHQEDPRFTVVRRLERCGVAGQALTNAVARGLPELGGLSGTAGYGVAELLGDRIGRVHPHIRQ